MSQRLKGKVALITGASSGIGHAAALLFAAEGAKVVLGARRAAELKDLACEIDARGGSALSLAGDVREEAYAVNLTGAFLGAKHQIAQMLKNGGGSVIFTSTFVGYSAAFPGVAAYAASKSGLIGLTQVLAAEFGPQGVRVNALLPGAVDTDMYRDVNDTPESQAFVTGLHALKRVASPEELARSALYLASDDSSFVSGTASLVDGGLSITRT
jgi:NAD(P)-dependent dehydrogenase (short-subunit alcohol dehydrogenase family)